MGRLKLGLVAGLLVLSGFSTIAAARDRLVIGYTAITGIKAGLWVAEEAGIFAKHNIQTDLILITSASKMVQAMLGGDVPFAAAGGNAAVDANLSGADIVMIGVLAKVPAFYLMALPEIKTIEDLRGKPVGVTRFGSSTDFTMRYLLRKHGMNPDRDVTLIQTGDLFAAAAMMKTKAIVAAPFSSPANLRAEEAGARSLLNMGTAGVYFPHDAWMARRAFLSSNEDLVRRFMRAYSEGVHRLFSDPPHGASCGAKIYPLERPQDRQCCHAIRHRLCRKNSVQLARSHCRSAESGCAAQSESERSEAGEFL